MEMCIYEKFKFMYFIIFYLTGFFFKTYYAESNELYKVLTATFCSYCTADSQKHLCRMSNFCIALAVI